MKLTIGDKGLGGQAGGQRRNNAFKLKKLIQDAAKNIGANKEN